MLFRSAKDLAFPKLNLASWYVYLIGAGKMIELEVDATVSDGDLEAMCQQLLANLVIENYRIERMAAQVAA